MEDARQSAYHEIDETEKTLLDQFRRLGHRAPIMISDATKRLEYIRAVKQGAADSRALADAATSLSELENIAKAASEARNALLDLTRGKISGISKEFSKALKEQGKVRPCPLTVR